MNSLKDYFIDIPQNLIAQNPIKDRSKSRLLYLNKNKNIINHYYFFDIVNLINDADVIVLNNTKVFKARYNFVYKSKNCEILLGRELSHNIWDCIIYPGRVFKENLQIKTDDGIDLKVESKSDYGRIISFNIKENIVNVLEKIGKVPLPPYINNNKIELARYQTVYSVNTGSTAAPTAGLHFTDEIILQLKKKGIKFYQLTLHIGPGTFRPIKNENLDKHKMHSEYMILDNETVENLNKEMVAGKNIIAVGTTTVRALETAACSRKRLQSYSGWTELFIKPPYQFKIVDKMLTNFHLPNSTLIVLVSAFAGIDNIKNAYTEAVNREYRFFSFGDAMFIE